MIIERLAMRHLVAGFLDTLAHLSPLEGMTPEQAEEILAAITRNPRHFIWVAVEDGQVVGAITLLIEPKFIRGGRPVGHIEDVVTRAGHEGRGVGSALMGAALHQAKVSKCRKVILDCAEANVAFYERFGFRRQEIEMRLDLK